MIKINNLLLAFIFVCLFQNLSQAQISDSDEELIGISKRNESLEQQFVKSNKVISQWFDDFTEGVDLFIVGKKVSKEKNQSSIRVDLTGVKKEGEGFDTNVSLSVRPRLQNLEKYFLLKFSNYDSENESRGVEKDYLKKSQNQQTYGAAIGFFQNIGHVKTTFQPRIDLGNQLNISHSLAFESLLSVDKLFFNPKIELYAQAKKGLGVFQSYNFNYKINSIFSLTELNEFDYSEKERTLNYLNGLLLGQVLNENSSMTYGGFIKSSNRPSIHVYEYTLSATYNRELLKKVLDVQITPFIDFNIKNRFKGRPGLVLNLGSTF